MNDHRPLPERMRPIKLDQVFGQEHLVASGKPLAQLVKQGLLHSMIFWGPPGTGKTTLARLLAQSIKAHFLELSAIFSGVKEIRAAMQKAELALQNNQKTVLFIDEIHRFNKAQQDAFLPYVEKGIVILIGATTENPSFEINSALLSRVRVYVLKRLSEEALCNLIQQTITDEEKGLGQHHLVLSSEQIQLLARSADGDARRALILLEVLAQFALAQDLQIISNELLELVFENATRRFDKQGEQFYNQISALHKSIRGSAPDAALYWFCRMIDGGCDPLYIARRLIRLASEDIGNADPRALTLTLNAYESYEKLGSPEGELAIAQAIVYCASAAKSNAVYVAYNLAMADAKSSGSLDVPLHLCNAPTSMMKKMGYGKAYRYAHDEPEAYAAGVQYFPDDINAKNYYVPKERGLEIQIKEKLNYLKSLDNQYKNQKSKE